MVKITNGVNLFEVTRGAFDGIYSRQGYHLVDEDKKTNASPAPTIPKKSKDEIFVEETLEKPISQWTKEEVKHFAAVKEIDISGTKNANEAKEIIKSFIDGE